ncbi:WD repeat-containing protein 26-like [Artemia franciscana]|uniref:WD repeat-containing protein 26-like n=1 Tax=Artemia franciscana TaxID=6661 RepID=UPI0032DAC5CA
MQQQSKNGFLANEISSSKSCDVGSSVEDTNEIVVRKKAGISEANGVTNFAPVVSLSKSEEEVVRLIGQHLNEIGLSQTAEKLKEESGCILDHPSAAHFQKHILSGKWFEAETDLEDLRPFLLDVKSLTEMRFLLLEEKFLELLEDGKHIEALHVLRHEMNMLNHDQERIHALSILMMASGPEELQKRAKWLGKGKASRYRLMNKLQSFLPASVMLPSGRLRTLLGQALTLQQQNCKFHNTKVTCDLGNFSLLNDHECSREQFPCVTVQTLSDHCDDVLYCKFSNDGSMLATGSKDSTVIIWNVDPETRKLSRSMTLDGHTTAVGHVAWSPKGDYLVVCAGGGEADCPDVWIWNVETGALEARNSNSPDDSISCASFSPDGRRFACGGLRGQFYICDLSGSVQEHWEGVRVQYCHWKNDSQILVADTHQRVRLYNFDDSTDFTVFQDDISNDVMSFAVDKSGRNIILNIKNQGIHWWDLTDRVLVRKFQGVSQGFFMNYSCFGGVNEDFIASGSEDNQVYIYHKSKENPIQILSGHTRNVNCVDWNPRYPDMLVSASDDGTIRVWGPAKPSTSKGLEALEAD